MRIRANQTKAEKDFENKDIKLKIKTGHKDKVLLSRSEAVYDRLSRPKRPLTRDVVTKTARPCNTTSCLPGRTRSRPNLSCKSPYQPVTPRTQGQSTNKRILPLSKSVNRRLCERRQKKSANIGVDCETRPEEIVYMRHTLKPIEEILSVRSIANSTSTSVHSKICSRMSSMMSNSNASLCSGSLSPSSPTLSTRCRFSSAERTFVISNFDFKEKSSSRSMESLESIESPDSSEDFQTSPLMPVPTEESLNMSAKITKKFRELLQQKQRTMPPEQIRVIKDVVKSDHRHSALQENDPKLFKNILRTQLQAIVKQEAAVKSALRKLESKKQIFPVNVIEKATRTESPQQKGKVDVIFKNVASLEKEIIILKSMGENLESTDSDPASKSTLSVKQDRILSKLMHELNWDMGTHTNSQVTILSMGIRQCLGIVQEFRIAHKTLCELKENEKSYFYIPVNDENTELTLTSFRKLKENPEILMRHLRSKNSLIPFNILDHDRIFFNSFLCNKDPRKLRKEPKKAKIEQSTDTAFMSFYKTSFNVMHEVDNCSNDSDQVVTICEGSGSKESIRIPYATLEEKEPLKIEEIRCLLEGINTTKQESTSKDRLEEPETKTAPPIVEIFKPQAKLKPRAATLKFVDKQVSARFEAPLRGKQRRRINSSVTPMPTDKYMEPKNNLLKTILIGSVQLTMFLLLIMAITFPDVKRCA